MADFLTPDPDSTIRFALAPRPRLIYDRDVASAARKPPHCLEVEQGLLGACFTYPEAHARISRIIQAGHFHEGLHAQIFETIGSLLAQCKIATPITVRPFFESFPPINDRETVPQYLGTLAACAPALMCVEDYARTVKDLADRRSMILDAEDRLQRLYRPHPDIPLIAEIADAQTALDRLRREQSPGLADDGLLYAGDAVCGNAVPSIVKGLVSHDSINAVHGPSTVGKTFWLWDLLWHIAIGKDYLGRRIKRVPILAIVLEGQSGIPNRLAALQKQYGGEAWFACLTLPVSLGLAERNAADEALIIAKADAVAKRFGQPVGVIAIDTYAQAVAGDNENEAATVAAFLARCQRIKAATGAAIIFTAHPGKNAALGIRGSSALSPALDTVIGIEREEAGASRRNVTLEKVKDGAEGPLGSFTLKRVELAIDDDGDPITSCIVEHVANAQPAEKQKQPKPGSPPALCLEELNQLLVRGKGKTVLHDRIPDGALCIDLDEWRTACYAKTICSSDASDTRRQAFHRAFGTLRTMGLVGSHDQHVWKIGVTKRVGDAAPCFAGENDDA